MTRSVLFVSRRGLAVVLGLLLLAGGQATAQTWRLQSFDDGSFFSVGIAPEGREGDVSLLCGERSPQGLTAAQTGNMEPEITPPDVLRLYLALDLLGPPQGMQTVRRDVMIVLGNTGYALPEVVYNGLFDMWQADLRADDAMFAALADQSEFELRSDAGLHLLPAIGFALAHGQLVAQCQSLFAAVGLPWASSRSAPPAAPSMRVAAEAAIRQGCGGAAASLDPGAFLTGDIDGDGLDDVVLDWRALRCPGPMPYPYCGASMCSADVFLSSAFTRTGRPENLLAMGVRLQPLSNGNMGVAVGGSMMTCQQRGLTACDMLFYWNGATLALIE